MHAFGSVNVEREKNHVDNYINHINGILEQYKSLYTTQQDNKIISRYLNLLKVHNNFIISSLQTYSFHSFFTFITNIYIKG